MELAYQEAMMNMARLNRTAAGLMHTFNAHAATDITGFGILGHAQNLAKQQRNEVSFVIHNLPVLAKMAAVSKACGNMFGLMHGTCPETSGKKGTPFAGLRIQLSEPGSHSCPCWEFAVPSSVIEILF